MILNHFTASANVDRLLGSGEIFPSESMIGAPDTVQARTAGLTRIGEHLGPDVVWLTTSDQPRSAGITGGPGAKGDVRVIVDVPDAECHRWSAWAREQGIEELWYDSMGRNYDPDSWWVVERSIPWSGWRRIEPTSSVPVGRNDPCPCGGGRKSKQCHNGRPVPIWVPADGIIVRLTREDVIRDRLTLVRAVDGGTLARNDLGETVIIPDKHRL